MSNIKKHTILNNESKVKKGQRFLLSYDNKNLVPCTIEEHEDDFDFLFNLENLDDFNTILDKTMEDKYRMLFNCVELEELCEEYEFSMSPSNIVLDDNLRSKVLVRDIKDKDNNFLNKYKALIATTLCQKYSYDDYFLGGNDLFRKNKNIEWLNNKDSVNEIKEYLYQSYKEEAENIQNNKTIVSKNTLRVLRVGVILLAVAAVGCGALMYYIFGDQLPKKDSYISASNAYLAENYEGVIEAFSYMDVYDISLEGKYMLSRSFVTSESLTTEQKEWVLQGLTLKTEIPILNFWIEVGRLNFVEAIDIAQRINDDELLLFAYIKQSVALENDTTLSGEEKTAQLSAIEAKIEKLSQEMTENELEAQASDTN